MKVVSGSDSRYLLYDLITHKEKAYHVSDLKPFVYDPAVTTPLDVARRDYMEFFVETIIDHGGNVKRKTDLEFLVSWLGYDDRDNSWEAFSYLRDTGKLHDYLTQKFLPNFARISSTRSPHTTTRIFFLFFSFRVLEVFSQ
jgi:Chromo (CHRromatin Organisation MOdifier) domain